MSHPARYPARVAHSSGHELVSRLDDLSNIGAIYCISAWRFVIIAVFRHAERVANPIRKSVDALADALGHS